MDTFLRIDHLIFRSLPWKTVVSLVAAFSLSGCVPPQSPSPMRDQSGYGATARAPATAKSDDRMQQLDRQITRVEKNYRSTTADLSRRLALMENEVHLLRGDLDQSRHENQRLKEKLADLDKLKAASAPIGGPAALPPPGPVTTEKPAAATKTAALAPTAMPESAQSVYDRAFQLLKKSDYEQARVAFEGFLKKFPDDGLADNAQYWIGELQYVQRHFPEALVAFNQVLTRWPASAKVPGSLLKIGFAFHELGDLENAKASLQRLIGDYPQSPAVAMAKQRLQLIDGGPKGL